MIDGMATGVQYRLLVVIAKSLQKQGVLQIAFDKLLATGKKVTRRQLFLGIDNSLFKGSAVLACLGNTHEHYTVIIGVTKTRYLLHDSDGLCWVSKKCLGVSTNPKSFRHLIYPKSVIALALQRNHAASTNGTSAARLTKQEKLTNDQCPR